MKRFKDKIERQDHKENSHHVLNNGLFIEK